MNPIYLYPFPLPLAREAALEVLTRLEDFETLSGHFLSFVMIPVEERLGEWRFAGSSPTLAGAFRRIGTFADAMGFPNADGSGFLRGILESTIYDVWNSARETPIADIGSHQIILCAEGQAPYDDGGVCILEVPSLADSGYASQDPETDFPQGWGHEREDI